MVDGETRVGIFAITNILPGEELAYKYNLEWNGGKLVRC
jgi:SET domain-containing protein